MLFKAKTIATNEEESIEVVGYYLHSNQDNKDLIIAKDSTPIENGSETLWQKFYETDINPTTGENL